MTLLSFIVYFFFFNDTATTEIYTLSLHDALPIYAGGSGRPRRRRERRRRRGRGGGRAGRDRALLRGHRRWGVLCLRSGEHTSELPSRPYLVFPLLFLKKKKQNTTISHSTTSC